MRKVLTFSKLKIISVSLLFLAIAFFCEPALRQKLSFAVTYFDQNKVNYDNLDTKYITEPQTTSSAQKKSHAPEPSTFFLVLSGVGGIILRFAQRRFKRFKRCLDVSLSIAGLTVSSPLILFAAILIKMNSKGPVIYRQNRVGKDGGIFEIYKLRTMRLDAEDQTGAVWAKENDPRITSVGRILRKCHIDEIPQLFNVLRGEMSIVGPRPERPELVRDIKELVIDYEKRLQVKPGITGLAQVWHKYDETIEDVKKKIKYDILYIKRMCLLVDLRILANTCVVVFTGRGAR